MAALLSAARAPDVGAESTRVSPLVHVRLLWINDLHGHLDPTELGGEQQGGVAGSPLISAHFRDEPTIEALRLLRFDVAAVGLSKPIDPRRRYSVAAGEFLASRGEGFTALAAVRDRKRLGAAVDALADHLADRYPPSATQR